MTQARKYGNSTYHNFTGKIYWAKVFQPEEFRGAVRYTIEFMPKDEAELKRLMSVMNENKKVKEPTDTIPGKYTTLSRPAFKIMKGSLVHFTPPVIYDKDGRTPLVKYVNEDGTDCRSYSGEKRDINEMRRGELFNIGNGTDARVNVVTYPTQMGIGSRLEGIAILDLVEYNPPVDDFSPSEETTSRREEEKKAVDKNNPPQKTLIEEMDDEIPF